MTLGDIINISRMQINSFYTFVKNMFSETVEDQISDYLKDRGVTIAWLAKQVNLSNGHLRNILRGKGEGKKTLTAKTLEKINTMLETNFKFPEPETNAQADDQSPFPTWSALLD